MNRLTSSFWVQAYIKKLNLLGVPAFVVSHGDDTAGAIIVKVNKLNGDAVLFESCLLYTSPSPRDRQKSRMPSSA